MQPVRGDGVTRCTVRSRSIVARPVQWPVHVHVYVHVHVHVHVRVRVRVHVHLHVRMLGPSKCPDGACMHIPRASVWMRDAAPFGPQGAPELQLEHFVPLRHAEEALERTRLVAKAWGSALLYAEIRAVRGDGQVTDFAA